MSSAAARPSAGTDVARTLSTMAQPQTVDELVVVLRPIMRAIASAVGPFCEVVLHDVSVGDVEHTIVAIENGHVTGRVVGGPSTDRGLAALRTGAAGDGDFGYATRTRDGRELRSSSIYYRRGDGQLMAILCINVDLTPMLSASLALQQVLNVPSLQPDRGEVFASDVMDLLDDLVEKAIASTGKTVAIMDRDDKVEVLRLLDEKGAFLIKRSIERVAGRLGISRGAAYRYLEEVRVS